MKQLGAVKFPAAALRHDVPLTKFERFCVLDHLGNAQEQWKERSVEAGRSRKAVNAVITKDWDWEGFQESGGLKRKEFEDVLTFSFTERECKTLLELAKELAERTAGDPQYALIDVIERVDWILTPAT